MKSLLQLIFLSTTLLNGLRSQPATEVYLFDLVKKNDTFELKNGLSVSANPGFYDNQPSFSKDGKSLYFVSMDSTGQTDIFSFLLKNGSKTNFSKTPDASEYSPTLTPDGKFISCIRVVGEEQLLWKFPLKGGEPVVVVPELVIGYHAWWNENTLVSFVLGEPQTLQVTDVRANTHKTVAQDIGRSIFRIPGKDLISFLQNRPGQTSLIQTLSPESGEISVLTEALRGSQDMAWTPEGEIVMGDGGDLFVWKNKSSGWLKISESGEQLDLKEITRIAVSPSGRKIALVVGE